jgi:FeoB-associated Cys-rich membrane protein
MTENIIVLLIFLTAVAFVIVKISRSVSRSGMTCGCGSEKGCAGCGDINQGHPDYKKKHTGTGGAS